MAECCIITSGLRVVVGLGGGRDSSPDCIELVSTIGGDLFVDESTTVHRHHEEQQYPRGLPIRQNSQDYCNRCQHQSQLGTEPHQQHTLLARQFIGFYFNHSIDVPFRAAPEQSEPQ